VLPPGFDAHAKTIAASILAYLDHFDNLNPVQASGRRPRPDASTMYALIAQAGILSLLMRTDPHTVYYNTPFFKEDNFKRSEMECFIRKQMEATHPRERTTWPEHWTKEEINRSKGDQPVTEITIMDGVTAYRRGGWEDFAASTPWKPVYQKGMEVKGFRSRVLAHGWVYCRWGRPRQFVNGEPADDAKAHGVQWRDPGFVEFRDVKGVPGKPKEKSRSRRSKGKGKEVAGPA
jgi:hypothetical protein